MRVTKFEVFDGTAIGAMVVELTRQELALVIAGLDDLWEVQAHLVLKPAVPAPLAVCWECIKHRHSQCTGKDDDPPVGTGGPCTCKHECQEEDADSV